MLRNYLVCLALLYLFVKTNEARRHQDFKASPINFIHFDNQSRAYVVRTHNAFRSAAFPPASRMKRLEWSNELEWVARTRSRSCPPMQPTSRQLFGHNLNGVYAYIGVNVFLSAAYHTRPAVMYKAMAFWYTREISYNHTSNLCDEQYCGTYTQMMGENTTQVGCAIAVCSNQIGIFTAVVCSYAPFLPPGQSPYRSGAACSECEASYECEDNLCAVNYTTPAPPSTTAEETTAALPSTEAVYSGVEQLQVRMEFLLFVVIALMKTGLSC